MCKGMVEQVSNNWVFASVEAHLKDFEGEVLEDEQH
jgi:hypothetical protein